MFCLYSLQQQKNTKRTGKYIKRTGKYTKGITIHNLWRNLYHYDYSYKSIKLETLKTIILILFPLYKNNHKNTKIFKINKSLVDYWGEKFNINYELHREIYSTFKFLENEN